MPDEQQVRRLEEPLSKKRRRKPNLPASTLRRYGGQSTPKEGGSDFDPDYSHVVQDLKRIGALAASFIIALLVLSVILN
jgi:hypothetical protein